LLVIWTSRPVTCGIATLRNQCSLSTLEWKSPTWAPLTGTAFALECPVGAPFAFTNDTGTGPASSFVLNPTGDLPYGVTCTVTVTATQVTDDDANDPPNQMAANHVFSFTVDAQPAVTTTNPTNGSINNAANTNIVVNFTENVTATTSSFTIECPAPGNLQTFTVSGSGSSSITLDPTSNLPIGVVCTVTVIATEIHDSDAGDPPDTMASNHVFTFGVKPDAVNDSRSATGNVRIQTTSSSGFSILTNDIGPGLGVTAFDTTSAQGGNVTVNTVTGTFTYNPPAGFEGADTFNYTVANAAGDDSAVVTINVSGMLWFIDDTAASCTTSNTTCGRLTNPFSTMAAFDGVNGGGGANHPAAGDHIFIYAGSYTAPFTLENNQRVIGQGATSSLSSLSGITPATDSDALPGTGGAKPSITSGLAANAFNLASGNQLYGLQFSNTGATAINKTAGSAGTFAMADIVINNSGSNGAGIVLSSGGTITATGINTINTRSGIGLQLNGGTQIGAGNVTFQSISVGNNDGNPDPANGILLNGTAAGALIITGTDGGDPGTDPDAGTGGTIQNTTSDGLSLTTANGTSLGGVNLTNTGAHGINMTGGTNLTLSTVQINGAGNSDNENGVQMLNVGGTFTMQGSSIVDAEEELIEIDNNNVSLTVNVGTVRPCTFTHGPVLGAFTGNGILLVGRGTTNFVLHVKDSTLTDIKGFGVQVGGDNTWSGANTNITLDNNDFLVTVVNAIGNPNNRANTINVQGRNTVDIDADIKNNLLDNGGGGGVQFGADESSNVSASITNNTVSDQFADAVLMAADENATLTVLVDGSQISNTSSDGMEIANAIAPGGTSALNATITNNVVNGHNNNSGGNAFFAGIGVFGGADAPDTTCVDIQTNNVSGNPNEGVFFDYTVDGSSFGDPITVEGAGAAAVTENDFLAPAPGTNVSGSGPAGRTFIGNAFYSNGVTCPMPVFTP
jgi:hypothetical protein